MIRKSLGVFVSLRIYWHLPFSLRAGVDTASQSKLSAAAIVDKDVAGEAGCRRGGRSRRCHSRETGRRGEREGYSSSTSPGPTCQRAGACYAAGGGRFQTAVCDGAEAPPQNAVLSCSSRPDGDPGV